ncbi:MAG: AAA family ATPase [Chloroflexi bacterium]|nr:AAA family ATPase [Chloroflexota bacterium]
MIRSIEALNFRCLRYVRQPLGRFHVLVGPNASGKTTFLDVVGFLSRLVADGLDAAVNERTQNFQDLVWGREGRSFELAIEAEIPAERRERLKKAGLNAIRYEVSIGLDAQTGEMGLDDEKALLITTPTRRPARRIEAPRELRPPRTIMTGQPPAGGRVVLNRPRGGQANYYAEGVANSGKGWYPSLRPGRRKAALGILPEDEARFPAATWLKQFLVGGVQNFVLNSLLIRKASPPGQGQGFRTDGSNLPWLVAELIKLPERFQYWLAHLQVALPDLQGIRVVEREDDKHRYLVLGYQGGLQVPSWMASDGTLRLLALTLPAFLPNLTGIFLVEEPENGIHPGAVDIAYQSLSSVYGAQVLLATHSPVILSQAELAQVLCFKKAPSGATRVVPGNQVPELRHWQGHPNLSVLFASGVLG